MKKESKNMNCNAGKVMTYEKMPYGSWCNASDKQRAQAIYKLIIRGYQGRILLSHDSAERHRFSQAGG